MMWGKYTQRMSIQIQAPIITTATTTNSRIRPYKEIVKVPFKSTQFILCLAIISNGNTFDLITLQSYEVNNTSS